jgi:hypothetical protein
MSKSAAHSETAASLVLMMPTLYSDQTAHQYFLPP